MANKPIPSLNIREPNLPSTVLRFEALELFEPICGTFLPELQEKLLAPVLSRSTHPVARGWRLRRRKKKVAPFQLSPGETNC